MSSIFKSLNSNIKYNLYKTLIKLATFQMMMMVDCFCGMVDRRKALNLISSRDHYQRLSPLEISDTLQTRSEPLQNLSSGFMEWSCAVIITTMPRRHCIWAKGLRGAGKEWSTFLYIHLSSLSNILKWQMRPSAQAWHKYSMQGHMLDI